MQGPSAKPAKATVGTAPRRPPATRTSCAHSNCAPKPRRPISAAIHPLNGTTLLVEFETGIGETASRSVAALEAELRKAAPTGLSVTWPGYRTLAVSYDPRLTKFEALEQTLGDLIATLPPGETDGQIGRRWRIPVCFETDPFAPDLPGIAAKIGKHREEVIALLLQQTYRVALLGFQPGFPYLAGSAPELELPRRPSPRPDAAAGTFKIAGKQAAFQSRNGPCGWHWVGRTPVPLFDAGRDPMALFSPGDELVLEQITASTFDELAGHLARHPGHIAELRDMQETSDE